MRWSILLLLLAAAGCEEEPAGDPAVDAEPVRGHSWIEHLGLDENRTLMGHLGGLDAPPAVGDREPLPQRGSPAGHRPFHVGGDDLYRYSCQSCHGPRGLGGPPEIKSLVGPVRATSAAFNEARMKKLGHPIPPAMARQLADQALATLRKRLEQGGQKMPAFGYLEQPEIEALVAYLQRLAGTAAADRGEGLLSEPPLRVGELLVRGTCHICHPATGPGSGGMMMMMTPGVIPSLASMPRDLPLNRVIYKVRQGATGMMGFRAQMPLFPYLTPQEVAAGYLFLRFYPPLAANLMGPAAEEAWAWNER